MTYATENEYEI